MNQLSTEKRVQILAVLCEGMGINAATRISDVSKNTVLKLLADVGAACAKYQDEVMRNLTCKRIECDEIWSFVGMKQKNVPEELQGTLGHGDVYRAGLEKLDRSLSDNTSLGFWREAPRSDGNETTQTEICGGIQGQGGVGCPAGGQDPGGAGRTV